MATDTLPKPWRATETIGTTTEGTPTAVPQCGGTSSPLAAMASVRGREGVGVQIVRAPRGLRECLAYPRTESYSVTQAPQVPVASPRPKAYWGPSPVDPHYSWDGRPSLYGGWPGHRKGRASSRHHTSTSRMCRPPRSRT